MFVQVVPLSVLTCHWCCVTPEPPETVAEKIVSSPAKIDLFVGCVLIVLEVPSVIAFV